MSKIISVLKRVLTVLVAGILVFISTACNTPTTQAKTLDSNPRPEVPDRAVTSPYEGGMNSYSDVDPRRDTTGVDTKAQNLINRAEENLSKRADSLDQYARNYRSGTPLGERIQNLGEDIGSSTQELTEGVAKGTQRGVRNLKANTQNAAEDTAKSANKAAENIKQNTEYAVKDAANKARQAVDNSSNFVDDKINEAAKNTQRTLSDKVDYNR